MSFRAVSLATIALAALAGGCADPLSPPTPPLLDDVSSNGGWWWNGGCPPRDAAEARLYPPSQEALSPELMERLAREFPPGGEAGRLERTLRDQGFSFRMPCPNAPAIRLAEFRQTGGGFSGPYPIFAEIAWEQDAAGRIVWTKGSVSFTGP